MAAKKPEMSPAAEATYSVLLECMGLFFQLRAAGQRSGHVTSKGGGIWGFLHSLAVEGPQTVPQLARARPVSRQHIQVIANEAAADGLIEFIDNPAHKRSKLLRLTPKGTKLHARLTEGFLGIAGNLCQGLDPNELQTASRVLNALRSRLAGTPVAPGRLLDAD